MHHDWLSKSGEREKGGERLQQFMKYLLTLDTVYYSSIFEAGWGYNLVKAEPNMMQHLENDLVKVIKVVRSNLWRKLEKIGLRGHVDLHFSIFSLSSSIVELHLVWALEWGTSCYGLWNFAFGGCGGQKILEAKHNMMYHIGNGKPNAIQPWGPFSKNLPTSIWGWINARWRLPSS